MFYKNWITATTLQNCELPFFFLPTFRTYFLFCAFFVIGVFFSFLTVTIVDCMLFTCRLFRWCLKGMWLCDLVQEIDSNVVVFLEKTLWIPLHERLISLDTTTTTNTTTTTGVGYRCGKLMLLCANRKHLTDLLVVVFSSGKTVEFWTYFFGVGKMNLAK